MSLDQVFYPIIAYTFLYVSFHHVFICYMSPICSMYCPFLMVSLRRSIYIMHCILSLFLVHVPKPMTRIMRKQQQFRTTQETYWITNICYISPNTTVKHTGGSTYMCLSCTYTIHESMQRQVISMTSQGR